MTIQHSNNYCGGDSGGRWKYFVPEQRQGKGGVYWPRGLLALDLILLLSAAVAQADASAGQYLENRRKAKRMMHSTFTGWTKHYTRCPVVSPFLPFQKQRCKSKQCHANQKQKHLKTEGWCSDGRCECCYSWPAWPWWPGLDNTRSRYSSCRSGIVTLVAALGKFIHDMPRGPWPSFLLHTGWLGRVSSTEINYQSQWLLW